MRVSGDLKLCRVVAKVVSCPALPLHNYHLSSPRRRSSHPLGGWRPASGGSSRPSCRWRHYLWCGSGFCVRILSVYQDSFAVSVSFCRVRILLTVSGSFCRIRILLPCQYPFDRIRILLTVQDPFAVLGAFCRIRILLPYQDPFAVSGFFCRVSILLPCQDSFCRIRILLPYQDPFAVSWSFCVVRIRLSNEDSIVKSRSLWSKKILALRQDPVV